MSCSIRYVFCFSLILLFGICGKGYTQTISYRDAINRIAFSIESKLNGNAPIAIIKFDSSSERFSNRIINDLTETLINDGVIVVDRQNLEKVLAEQNFQLSGYVSDESVVRIGQMLGAQFIIIGSGENMTDYYHVQIKMLHVETATIQNQVSQNIKYDAEMLRLLNQKNNITEIGDTRFLIGVRIGPGFQINTADADMVGTGFTPNEKSNIAFNVSLYGAFKFSSSWSIQPELNFLINNGMEISGQGYTINIDYPTLDIPILIRWNFVQEPVLAGIVLGPYFSMPIGKLNLRVDNKGSALDMNGYSFGITGGFTVGWRLGSGYIAADIRFLNDFSSLNVRNDFGDGMQDAKIMIRRSVNLTVGYEISL